MQVIASDRGARRYNAMSSARRWYAKGLKASVGYVAVGVEARRSIPARGGTAGRLRASRPS